MASPIPADGSQLRRSLPRVLEPERSELHYSDGKLGRNCTNAPGSTMMAPHIGRYAREIGCGLLDIGTCGDGSDDGADAAGALGDALLQRLAESGVL